MKAALEGRSITLLPDDVYMGCLTGEMILWLAVRPEPIACAVTKIVDHRRARVCQILVIGGREIAAWLHFEEEIRKMAKDAGCDAIEGCGRPGWRRKAPGYEPVYTVFRRKL